MERPFSMRSCTKSIDHRSSGRLTGAMLGIAVEAPFHTTLTKPAERRMLVPFYASRLWLGALDCSGSASLFCVSPLVQARASMT
jgi:hypothetical protein